MRRFLIENGGESLLGTIKIAVLPIAKVFTMCFLGFLMASKYVNILPASGRKLLNGVSFLIPQFFLFLIFYLLFFLFPDDFSLLNWLSIHSMVPTSGFLNNLNLEKINRDWTWVRQEIGFVEHRNWMFVKKNWKFSMHLSLWWWNLLIFLNKKFSIYFSLWWWNLFIYLFGLLWFYGMGLWMLNVCSKSVMMMQLVFSLLLPCLIFSQLGQAVTLQKMIEWWDSVPYFS